MLVSGLLHGGFADHPQRMHQRDASIVSLSRSSRRRPRVNVMISLTASAMCRNRIRSPCFILHLGHADDFIAQIAAEITRYAQIDLSAADQFGQFQLDFGYGEKTRPCFRRELDQDVHVAVGAIGSLKHRPEQRQPGDKVTPAERVERGSIGKNLVMRNSARSYDALAFAGSRTPFGCSSRTI